MYKTILIVTLLIVVFGLFQASNSLDKVAYQLSKSKACIKVEVIEQILKGNKHVESSGKRKS